jgi:hypothetical protein
MRKAAILNVAVQNKHKTSTREAGSFDLRLDDGEKLIALGHFYFPDHDRSLFEGVVFPLLEWYKPRVILILGGAIHDDAFQALAPRALRRVAFREHDLAPEVLAAKNASDMFEERIRLFGLECGRFLSSLADRAGDRSTVVYIPSSSPLIPCENEIMTFLSYTKQKVDSYRAAHPDQAPAAQQIPCLPIPGSMCSAAELQQDFAALLGLTDDPRVQVQPFGSAIYLNRVVENGILINGGVRFEVGSRRLMNPLSAAFRSMYENRISTIRGFDGKLSTGWLTQVRHSLLAPRRHLTFGEVPNLMDSERMGYLGDDQRWAKGIYCGNISRRLLHGQSFPIQRGVDGRRGVVIYGREFQESSAAGYGRTGSIILR